MSPWSSKELKLVDLREGVCTSDNMSLLETYYRWGRARVVRAHVVVVCEHLRWYVGVWQRHVCEYANKVDLRSIWGLSQKCWKPENSHFLSFYCGAPSQSLGKNTVWGLCPTIVGRKLPKVAIGRNSWYFWYRGLIGDWWRPETEWVWVKRRDNDLVFSWTCAVSLVYADVIAWLS